MKTRVFIWGAGSTGRKVRDMLNADTCLLGFIDMNEEKWGSTWNDFEVFAPEVLQRRTDYDAIVLGTLNGEDVADTLEDMGISSSKLDTSYVDLTVKPRIQFLKSFADVMKAGEGAVAEAGVFRGDFAKYINECFPKNTCYLFDTFEGFDARDFSAEKKHTDMLITGHLKSTSEQVVYNKMPHKENVKILKGYFPDTVTKEVLNQKYVFVNLDMDLYKPTLDGLRIFYPRMVDGGVILVHDYFNENYPNIKEAIFDFEKELGERLHKMPIGDGISIAVIK